MGKEMEYESVIEKIYKMKYVYWDRRGTPRQDALVIGFLLKGDGARLVDRGVA